jgi:Helix-turn-helix domain
MTSPAQSRLKAIERAAENNLCFGDSASNEIQGGTSEVSRSNCVIQLRPLALQPLAAAQFLSISKRSLSRLIAAGKIVARKEGSRTLVDVESLQAFYASLPKKR